MPIDLDRSNRIIVKRFVSKSSLNEDERSDASRYREVKILVMTADDPTATGPTSTEC